MEKTKNVKTNSTSSADTGKIAELTAKLEAETKDKLALKASLDTLILKRTRSS